MNKLPFIALCITALFLVSCDEDEDVCGECNDAIDHMYGKLQDNACNPDFMSNAYQRIVEHCGATAANYNTGFMAHNCEHDPNNFRALNCQERDEEQYFSVVEINNVEIRVEVVSNAGTVNDFYLEVRLEPASSGGSEPPSALLEVGEVADFEFDGISNGEPFSFSLLDGVGENGEIYIEDVKNLFFYRPGNWTLTRTISVFYDPITESYGVNYNHW